MEKEDVELIKLAKNGNKKDLETLIVRHYDFIYNVAIRMVFYKQDAQDLTQDIIVKLITNLSSFQENQNFKGWLYRLTVNHFLNIRKRPIEKSVSSFSSYGNGLDTIKDSYFEPENPIESKLILEEIKISCTRGMLMCLSRPQRLLYIFGEILEIDHNLGAYIFETTKENYRKKLSRTRNDLQNFMNKKCSLINSNNPCKCRNKTKGFIENGWIDPKEKTFTKEYSKLVNEVISPLSEHLENKIPNASKKVFQEQPFYNPANKYELLKDLKLETI